MNHIKHYIVACVLAGLAAGPATAQNNIYTYQITTDTYLDSANPGKNYGSATTDKVVINSTSMCRTLFDLPSGLWASSPSDIVSASVSFYVWSDSTATYNVSLFPLTRAFTAGTGNGTTPANGATWNTFDGTSSWTTPGGDFDSANSVAGVKGTLGVNPNDPNGRFFSFDITSLLANPTAATELEDYGAMLWIDETVPPSGQRYAAFTSANSATYSIPYLPSVELTVVPEPSSVVLAMLGMIPMTCLLKNRKARC